MKERTPRWKILLLICVIAALLVATFLLPDEAQSQETWSAGDGYATSAAEALKLAPSGYWGSARLIYSCGAGVGIFFVPEKKHKAELLGNVTIVVDDKPAFQFTLTRAGPGYQFKQKESASTTARLMRAIRSGNIFVVSIPTSSTRYSSMDSRALGGANFVTYIFSLDGSSRATSEACR